MAVVQGTNADDILQATFDPDEFRGEAGFDFADYSDAPADPVDPSRGVWVSLLPLRYVDEAAFQQDTYDSIEGLIGSRYNDLLEGDEFNNQLRGGTGGDILFGFAGADTLDGGAGTDGAYYSIGSLAGVTVSLENSALNTGDAAGDVFISIEDVFGSDYDDSITGDAGDNVLSGRSGADVLNARDGNDRLHGGDDADTIIGGSGNDYLWGGSGSDDLDGGSGYDVVVFDAPSTAFTWARSGDGSWAVTDLRVGSPEGSDTLRNVEAIEFSDRAFGLPGSLEADDVFRFYNTSTKTHFYTSSEGERDAVIANRPHFKYEGNVFDSTATAETGTEVFRFYNTKTKSHFYTASAAERDSVIEDRPHFKYEGVAYYGYDDSSNGAHIPLYRFYNTKTKTHFYTASDAEQQQVLGTRPHFKYEGIAYWVDLA